MIVHKKGTLASSGKNFWGTKMKRYLVVTPTDLQVISCAVIRNINICINMRLCPIKNKAFGRIVFRTKFLEEFTTRVWKWNNVKITVPFFLIYFLRRCHTEKIDDNNNIKAEKIHPSTDLPQCHCNHPVDDFCNILGKWDNYSIIWYWYTICFECNLEVVSSSVSSICQLDFYHVLRC